MKTKILVASHKPYKMPEDTLYLPIYVGADLSDSQIEGFIADNTGDNISYKNKTFCELTALYWAWKNLKDIDTIGLCHYRRYFCESKQMYWSGILTDSHIEKLLGDYNLILPKPRNYFIETNYSQYIHAHHEIDLIKTREIIDQKHFEYLPAYDAVMKRTWGHRFNMFIMPEDLFNSYCEWLFSILFELEQNLNISNYSDYDKRVFGFVSERLLDIWVEHNKLSYCELPVWNVESENWPSKIANFLYRKIVGKQNE